MGWMRNYHELGALTRAGTKNNPRLTKRGAEGYRIGEMHAYAVRLQELSDVITSRWVFRTTHNVDNLNSRPRSDR
jgi:hypothetical protein